MLANEIEVTITVRHPQHGKMGSKFRVSADFCEDDFKTGMEAATKSLIRLTHQQECGVRDYERFLQEISEHPF